MSSSWDGSAAGRLAVVAVATASEYFKYVSIDATTTRASTVMRSIPTNETRTHASMTIPLSSTRSRTSMRLVPPAARSTGIGSPISLPGSLRDPRKWRSRQRREPPFQRADLPFEVRVLRRHCPPPRRKMMIKLPPVQADLFRLVDRTDQQADSDRQQLDFRERHADVAGHDQTLVENAIKHANEPSR